VTSVAVLPFSVPVPIVFSPSQKVTIPVGPLELVAVKTIALP
jgi:hypothetical protein